MPFFRLFSILNQKLSTTELTIQLMTIIFEPIRLWCAHVGFKKNKIRAKVEKIRKNRSKIAYKSKTIQPIFILKPVFESVNHKLSADTYFWREIQILKSGFLIGRKFSKFFWRIFFSSIFQEQWLF